MNQDLVASRCPFCGDPIEVSLEDVGRPTRCPKCDETVVTGLPQETVTSRLLEVRKQILVEAERQTGVLQDIRHEVRRQSRLHQATAARVKILLIAVVLTSLGIVTAGCVVLFSYLP